MELEVLPKADSLSVVLGNLEGPERSEKSQHLGRKKGGGVWGECIWDGGGEMRSQLPSNLSGQERRGYRGREEGRMRKASHLLRREVCQDAQGKWAQRRPGSAQTPAPWGRGPCGGGEPDLWSELRVSP